MMSGSEDDFLRNYDPAAYDRPAVAVDLVLMTVRHGSPAALLVRRDRHPALGGWALPGGFVRIAEGLDAAARRVLREKARIDAGYVEQLFTFGEAGRDPRMRVVTVAHFALLPAVRLAAALDADPALTLARVDVPWTGEAGGPAGASGDDGPLKLAFDHADILGLAVLRLRGKLGYAPVAFALLPELFTLRALQDVHEAILGVALNKPAFRRRMIDQGWIEATGARETGASFRPAELFRLKPEFRQEGDR